MFLFVISLALNFDFYLKQSHIFNKTHSFILECLAFHIWFNDCLYYFFSHISTLTCNYQRFSLLFSYLTISLSLSRISSNGVRMLLLKVSAICTYISVVFSWLCPNSSFTIFKSVPARSDAWRTSAATGGGTPAWLFRLPSPPLSASSTRCSP